jgi:hypothetical protein
LIGMLIDTTICHCTRSKVTRSLCLPETLL